MKLKKAETKSTTVSFEDSLRRLEEIIESLEAGDVTLNDVMKMYEEGVNISKTCLEQLSQAEVKLKRLTKDVHSRFELLDDIKEE